MHGGKQHPTSHIANLELLKGPWESNDGSSLADRGARRWAFFMDRHIQNIAWALFLRGLFLGREQDTRQVLYGMGKTFPEAYQPYLSYIPENERGDLLKAYYSRVMDPDPAIHMPAARTFIRYDMTCSTHLPNPAGVEKIVQNERLVLSLSRAFLQAGAAYDFFREPDQMLANVKHIAVSGYPDPGSLGYDQSPEMAYELHQT